jgi:hypothetical protein
MLGTTLVRRAGHEPCAAEAKLSNTSALNARLHGLNGGRTTVARGATVAFREVPLRDTDICKSTPQYSHFASTLKTSSNVWAIANAACVHVLI